MPPISTTRKSTSNATYALSTLPGDFTDPGIPAGFAPFNVQNIAGTLYVTYAMQDADAEDEIAGPGLGYVSAFDTDGNFLGRVASGGDLNAPWGLAWAPAAGFGKFSGDLLVGNFGDGAINAFAATGGGWEARGHLKTPDHHRLTIDGLWGSASGTGTSRPAPDRPQPSISLRVPTTRRTASSGRSLPRPDRTPATSGGTAPVRNPRGRGPRLASAAHNAKS